MQHLIFWQYIISLILGIVSTFMAIMTLPIKNIKWLRYYTFLLISLNTIMITYVLHYFLYIYVDEVPLVILNIFSLLIGLGTLAILVFSYQLLFDIIDFNLDKRKCIVFVVLSMFCLSLTILLAFFTNKEIKLISLIVYALLFIGLFIISFIFRIKIFTQKNIKKKIIISLLTFGALGFIGELIEVMIRNDLYYDSNNIPVGIVSFSFFSIALNLTNFLYCFNRMKQRKIGFLFSEELPNKFLNEFKITNSERDIILYLLNAYTQKEIANIKSCSVRTINVHVYNIYKKCDVSSFRELSALLSDYSSFS